MDRFQDRQVLSKILQESILQMCKVSVGLHSNISIDGIICIAQQDDEREIIVKIHEQVNRGVERLDKNTTQNMSNYSAPIPVPPVTTSPCISTKPNRAYVDSLNISKPPELMKSSIPNQISKDYFLGDEHELFDDLAAIKAIMPLNSAHEASLNHSTAEDLTINLIDDESIDFGDNFVNKPIYDTMYVKPDPGMVSSCTVANVVSSEQEVCAVTSVLETRPSIKKSVRSRLSFTESPIEEGSDDDLKIEKLKAGRIRRHQRIPSECSTRFSPTEMINCDALPYGIQDPVVQAAKIRSPDDPQISIYHESGDVDIKPIVRQKQGNISSRNARSNSGEETLDNSSPHSFGDCQQHARVISGSDDLDQAKTCSDTISTASYTTITPNIKTQCENTAPTSYTNIFPNDTDAVITSYKNITPRKEGIKGNYASNVEDSSMANVRIVASYNDISPEKKKRKTDVKPSNISVQKMISFQSTGVTVAEQLHILREQHLVQPDTSVNTEVPLEDIKMDILPQNFGKEYKCPICKACQDAFKKHHTHMYRQHNVFPCPCCEKMFSHRYSRNRHIVSHHAGSKTFMCPFCSKKYVRADTLKLHIQKQHPDSMDQVKIHYSYAHSKQLYEPDSTEPSCSVTRDPDVVYNHNLPSKFETMEPEDNGDSVIPSEESALNNEENSSQSMCYTSSKSCVVSSKTAFNTNTMTSIYTACNNSTNKANFTSRVINASARTADQNICLVTENSNQSCSDNSNSNDAGEEDCIRKDNIADHARVVGNEPMVVLSHDALSPLDDDSSQNDTCMMNVLDHDDIIDMIEISDEETHKGDD